jgi:hypothetical protein
VKKRQRQVASIAGSNDLARGKGNLPREIDRSKGGEMVAVMVPRSALTAVIEPETLSQRNVLATEGIPPRLYLETLRRDDFDVPIAALGKLRLVDRAAFVAWLRARAVVRPAPANDAEPTEELDEIDRALVSAGGRVSR